MDIQELLVSFDQNTVEFTDVPTETTSAIQVEDGNSDLEYFYATSEVNMDKSDIEFHELVNPVGEITISKPIDSTNFNKYKLNLIGAADSVAKVYNGVYFRSLLPYKSVGNKRDINIASNATLTAYEPNGVETGSSVSFVTDGNLNNRWNPLFSDTENVKAIFEFDNSTELEYVEIFGLADDNGYAPYDWKVTGSDDGITWNLVHVTSWESNSRENNIGEVRTPERCDTIPSIVRLDTTVAYKFYAIEFINFNNPTWNTIPIKEIKLYEKSDVYTKYYDTEDVDLAELKFIFENTTKANLYTSTLTEWYISYSLDNNNFTRMNEVNYSKNFLGSMDNLVNPANYTIEAANFENGVTINNLFDGVITTFASWTTNNDYFELTVENSFRIWSKTSTPLHDSRLNIMMKDIDGDWIPTTAGITNKDRQIDVFELASLRLAPGSYRFYASDDYSTGGVKNQRTDTEWFIERELELKEWDFINLSTRTLFFKSISTDYSIDFFNHRKPEIVTTVPKLFVTESPEDFLPELHFDNNIVLAMPLSTDLSFYKGGNGFNTSSVGVTFVEDGDGGTCAKFSDIDSSAKIVVDPSSNLSYTSWTFSFKTKRDEGFEKFFNSMLMSVVGDGGIYEFYSQMKTPFRRETQNDGGVSEMSDTLINNINRTPNIWRHIILTCNLSTEVEEGQNQVISLYIDGKNTATFQIRDRNSYTLSIYKIILGGYNNDGYAFNGGYIKDFIFYNRGFTETDEITKLVNTNLTFVEKPQKQLVVDIVDIETGTLTYNIEKCDTTKLEIDYDSDNISKLDFNFKSVDTELLESKILDTDTDIIHYYNKSDIWSYEIEAENDLLDMEAVSIIGTDTITSTTDITEFLVIDFKITKINTKTENNGVFTYTFDGDTHLPQNFKYISNSVIIDRVIGELSTDLTVTNKQIIRKNSSNNLTYNFVKPSSDKSWFGFIPSINVSVVDILGYQYVSETKFIATEEIPLQTIVVNSLNDSFKIVGVEPAGTRLLYTVEQYKVRENIIDINGATLRDETNLVNLLNWSNDTAVNMNNQIIHHLEGHSKNTISFDISEDIETLEISFRYYSLDFWDDNLNDYGFMNINGIQKWMSKRNGTVIFEDYNVINYNRYRTAYDNRRFNNYTRISNTTTAEGWTSFSDGVNLGSFRDNYQYNPYYSYLWYNQTTTRNYNLKYYKDITFQLSVEDVKALDGKLTIDIGLYHHSDQTTGSGGFNNFKVSATKSYSSQNLKRLPFNDYTVIGTKLDEVELTLDDVVNYDISYPTVDVKYRKYMMTADNYKFNVTRETPESFNKVSLETIRRAIEEPSSCLDIMRAGDTKGNGVYTINPTGNEEIQVYCDMTTDGGGWTLVGKGREGWEWNNSSQHTFGELANNSTTNTVAHMDSITIDKILNKSLYSLEDGIRIQRPDLSQNIYWKFLDENKFTWDFPSNKRVEVIFNNDILSFDDQNIFDGEMGTSDQYLTGKSNNDCTRIFTFDWSGHDYIGGFSTGNSCSFANSWGSNYKIARTLVWVRK